MATRTRPELQPTAAHRVIQVAETDRPEFAAIAIRANRPRTIASDRALMTSVPSGLTAPRLGATDARDSEEAKLSSDREAPVRELSRLFGRRDTPRRERRSTLVCSGTPGL